MPCPIHSICFFFFFSFFFFFFHYVCFLTYVAVITKTYLYNFDPLKPHFYIVKLGFTGVYIIFSYFCSKTYICGYSLEPPQRGEAVLTSTHSLCSEQKYKKYQNFYLKTFSFLVLKFSIYLNRRAFVMVA